MAKFTPGQLVKLAPQWMDTPREAEARYVVVEDNGDRLIVELVCDLPIRPQETVRPEMIEAAEAGE